MHKTLASLTVVSVALVACAVPVEDPNENPGTLASDLMVHKVQRITTISYAPNSFVIGNAYPGWTDDVQGDPQFSHGPGNPKGASYRWGFLYGENFDHCAWIDDGASTGSTYEHAWKCGSPQQIDTPYFFATYTNGMSNHLAGDGSLTYMHYAGSGCTDHHGYGNVAPWRVPATPANPVGVIPNGRQLRWRYVSKDGEWVLVRDASGVAPNWYFVHRGCVSLENTE
jgi:hypothetical protein